MANLLLSLPRWMLMVIYTKKESEKRNWLNSTGPCRYRRIERSSVLNWLNKTKADKSECSDNMCVTFIIFVFVKNIMRKIQFPEAQLTLNILFFSHHNIKGKHTGTCKKNALMQAHPTELRLAWSVQYKGPPRPPCMQSNSQELESSVPPGFLIRLVVPLLSEAPHSRLLSCSAPRCWQWVAVMDFLYTYQTHKGPR